VTQALWVFNTFARLTTSASKNLHGHGGVPSKMMRNAVFRR
jgi:hypothetical protein